MESKNFEMPWYRHPGWFSLIIAVVVLLSNFFGNYFIQSVKVDLALSKAAQAEERTVVQSKEIEVNGNRITALETSLKNLCFDMGEIKKELKDIRTDQLDYYKTRGYNGRSK